MTALTRAALAAAGEASVPSPVRIVHLGLGAFHRAHQAWYTQHAGDGWGIAAFTGRSPRAAEPLAVQDGLYALVARGADGDDVEIIASISEARDGADLDRLCALLSDPQVGVVTLTITEAGYRLGPDGDLDLADLDTQHDIRALRDASLPSAAPAPAPAAPAPAPSMPAAPAPAHERRGSREGRSESAESVRLSRDLLPPRATPPGPDASRATPPGSDASPHPVTPLGRLLLGLQARRASGAGPIAVVPCDNIPANGELTRRALAAMAQQVDPALAAWVVGHVSVVSTSVDRITPAHDGEVDAVVAAGWHDRATVVTEPFADWVLSGDFPAGRPAWENAGARFVDDIAGWENRKLWLLNGAHTILVAAGMPRGHATVAEAIADAECRRLVEDFWAEAVDCLPADVEHEQYRRQLIERFENPRIEHRLAQIAAESCAKVRYRLVPIARTRREQGTDASAATAGIAAWIGWALAGFTAPDRERDRIDAALADADPVLALLTLLDSDLAGDRDVVVRVRGLAEASVTETHPTA